jgi:platelet-activating factor acetylhydrolase IB subunit alpha
MTETDPVFTQTARLWDASSGETKMEFRDHDHVVEVAVFAPLVSHAAIRELIGLVINF